MKCWREPSLEDILSDPITQAVISADGVDTGELDALLRRVAARLWNGVPLAKRRGT
jgi:hypothetical protein